MDTYIEFCIRFWEATRELDLYSMDGSQLDRLIVDALSKTNGGKELIKTSMNELSVLIRAINHNNRKIHPPSLPSNLEEAAKEYAKTTFKKPHSDNPNEEVTIVEPDKYAGFIAGAKWDKEQIMSNAVEGWVAVDSDTYGKRRVTFFPQKPVREVLTEYKYWAATHPRYESIKLDSNAFPSLKWEDEPKKVKLIIIKED